LLAAQRSGGVDRGRGGRCDDSDELLTIHSVDTHNSIVRLDIMRLPLGILSGVGFIGAGAILRRGDTVRGVTTAATIWLVTVVGRCFGGGQL
jgi:putative Mg2+ transporter-C (MgtC) family protein